ncbi:MAG: trigger factor [Chloroflexota bacterium]|nr:trigger factor [Chloroflexota bacterium]
MNITREDTSQREVVLQIELDSNDLAPHLDRAYRRLAQRVKIPGFRPGKAPRVLVENIVGRAGLLNEALDRLAAETVQKAMDEQKVEPFGLPLPEVLKLDPVTIKATVPLKPDVNLGDYKSVRVEPKPVEVADARVDSVVEELRGAVALWEPVERPAKFGDRLTMDVNGRVDSRRVADDKAVEYLMEKDSVRPLPGFATHMEGLSKGQDKEFTLPVPADYPDKAIADKECRFSVRLLEVKEKRLPALDDAFAKSVGEGFETLEALRSKVRGDLEEQARRAERRRVQDEAVEAVVKGATVVMSPLLVEHEVDHMLEERSRDLRERRMDMETYLKAAGMTPEELREEMRAAAQQRLTRSVILGSVAEVEKLEATDEEVSKEIEELATRSSDANSVRAALSNDSNKRSISNAVLTRKVLERLAEFAKGGEPVAPAAAIQPQETSAEGAPHAG